MAKGYLKILIIIKFALVVSHSFAQDNTQNPLLVYSDNLSFNEINSAHITEAVSFTMSTTQSLVNAITEVPPGARTFDNTLKKLDLIWFKIVNLSSKLQLITAVYEDDTIRRIAAKAGEQLSKLGNELSYNEQIYFSLKDLSTSGGAKSLTEIQIKFMLDEIRGFETRGIHINKKSRKELQFLQDQINRFGNIFENNIWNDEDTLSFRVEELIGVPDNVKSKWSSDHGLVHIPVNRQNNRDIGSYADIPLTRKRMYVRHLSKAFPKNKPVLDSLIKMRYILANKLGYNSFAQYALNGSMAKDPERVWAFQNNLATKLKPIVAKSIHDLQLLKSEQCPNNDSVFLWDVRYYKRKLRAKQYDFDSDELKKYFEMNNTIDGMFKLFERLFSIDIKEISNIQVWSSNVRGFELWIDGHKRGIFYLDLISRRNKAEGFFCNPISVYYKDGQREILPVSALIGNFFNSDGIEPQLLTHEDVVLLFHEFGHVLHSLIGRTELAAQRSFGVKQDFVEAPSQFLENWCWEYEAVNKFARHYLTGKELPRDLFNKLVASHILDSGIDAMSDLYYGLLDLTLHDNFEEFSKNGPEAIAQKLYSLNQVPYPNGARLVYSIGHLNGYASNCYSYLWSKSIAQDLFSIFKRNGILDSKTGIKYRKSILEKGSSEEETKMLTDFLGRDFNSEPFIKQLIGTK